MRNPIVSIHDVGAGGLSNAIPELLNDSAVGGQIDLRKIPNDEPGMSPMQIWCNEAQERYVLGVRPERLAEFEAICRRERCIYAVVGHATAVRHLTVRDDLLGDAPIDLPLDVLFGKAPKMHRDTAPCRAHAARAGSRRRHPRRSDPARARASRRWRARVSWSRSAIARSVACARAIRWSARSRCRWPMPRSPCSIFAGHAGEAMAIGERTPLALIDAAPRRAWRSARP